jgi:micrococcal nuclease
MVRRPRPTTGAGRKKARGRSRIGRAQALAGTLVLLLVVLGPRLGDVVNAAVTRTDGCRIYALIDGDTVWMHCPGSGFRSTRLMGFDTPEFRAQCGREFVLAYLARHGLRWELWRAGEITVFERGEDRYDRRLARVSVDGTPLARRMIDTGLARFYGGGIRRGWCG